MNHHYALDIHGIRLVDTHRDSALLKSLCPEKNLDFEIKNRIITVCWLDIAHDPIILKQDIKEIKTFLTQSDPLGEFLLLQDCKDLDGPFDLFKLFPLTGNQISAKDWAHYFVHLSLIHAPAAVIGTPDVIEDRIFYNPANPKEICVAYSVEMDLCALATYLGHTRNFLQSLADNCPDPAFLEWMEAHRYIYSQYLEAHSELYRRRPRATAHSHE